MAHSELFNKIHQDKRYFQLSKNFPKLSQKAYSDVHDEQGNQYVDLVQEGGGVLGIALVGYVWVLESCKIRFMSLAGTSAGAINTIGLAGLKEPHESVYQDLIELLGNKSLLDFVDGGSSMKNFISKATQEDPKMIWLLLRYGYPIFSRLRDYLGMNPGDNFLEWLKAALKEAGIETTAQLIERRNTVATANIHFTGEGRQEFRNTVGVVTSEITTNSKIVLPRDGRVFYDDVDNTNPAEYARASMSIPFFFHPYRRDLRKLGAGQTNHEGWIEVADYRGEVPKEAIFVDGGMLSNFPINLFHSDTPSKLPPRKPTFGARLSAYRNKPNKIKNSFSFAGAMISTMRQVHDYDFLLKNPDFKQLICHIDADQDYNWLDFNISDENKIGLFFKGAEAAVSFLDKFNWDEYKSGRVKGFTE